MRYNVRVIDLTINIINIKHQRGAYQKVSDLFYTSCIMYMRLLLYALATILIEHCYRTRILFYFIMYVLINRDHRFCASIHALFSRQQQQQKYTHHKVK